LEDPSFEGATVATLRKHFKHWAKASLKEEQGMPEDYYARTGRYLFFIIVDQETMESVLSTTEDDDYGTGFVRLVNAEWKPEVTDEEDIANDDVPPPEEPLGGCTENGVDWMKVWLGYVELPGFHKIRDRENWEAYYTRTPEMADLP
jgi:hypothetical protein